MNKAIVIATIRPWNIKSFKIYFGSSKNYILITKKSDLTAKNLEKINPRYIFFPHWSWIISPKIWQKYECVVFHMTDLPFGRGGTPLQNLLLLNKKQTNISAVQVIKNLDAGNVYLKHQLNLTGSAEEIYERAAKIIYKVMIPSIVNNHPIPKPQKGKVTLFKRRTPNMSQLTKIDSLTNFYDLIRMVDAPQYPKAYININKFRIEFSNAKLYKNRIMAQVKIYEK